MEYMRDMIDMADKEHMIDQEDRIDMEDMEDMKDNIDMEDMEDMKDMKNIDILNNLLKDLDFDSKSQTIIMLKNKYSKHMPIKELTPKQKANLEIYQKLGGSVDTTECRKEFIEKMEKRQCEGFKIHPFF